MAGKATSPAMRRGLAGFRRVRRRDRARLGAPSAAPAFHLALSGPTHDVCAQHDNRLTRRMLSRCRGATAPGRAENVRRSSARVGAKPQHRAWLAILRGSRRGRAPRACEPASGRSRRGDPRLLTVRLPQGVCPWPTWSDTPPTVVRVQQSQVAATHQPHNEARLTLRLSSYCSAG